MSLTEREVIFLPEIVSSQEKRVRSFVSSIKYLSRISLAVLALNYGVAPRQQNNELSSTSYPSYAERIVTSLLGSAIEAEAAPLPGRNIPTKGQIIFLSKGTQIREGPGFRFKSTIPAKWGGAVPEDNWAVKVISNKEVCADNWIWIDTDRKLAGDPAGGTGWAALFTPCEEPPTPVPPTVTPRPPEPPQKITPIPSASPHDTKPEKGKIFLLKRGTQIRKGPGFGYESTIPLERGLGVPEDNWAVMVQNVANSPQCADSWMWWDVSRKDAGDPAGGTGWASISSPCETAKPTITPIVIPRTPTVQPTLNPTVQPVKVESPNPETTTVVTNPTITTPKPVKLPTPIPSIGIHPKPESNPNKPMVIPGSMIEQKWHSYKILGPLTQGERDALPSPYGTTGRVANFAGGFIHSSRYGTYETHGDIAKVYVSTQGSKSWLGFPTSNEYIDPQTRHPRSNFEGGYITWRENEFNPELGGYFTAFDLQGCPNRDCVQPQDRTFQEIAEALTGMEWSIDTLSDEHASVIDKGLATGNIALTFLPGGIIIKGVKGGKSILVPAEKLAALAEKELAQVTQRLISTLKQIRHEKAIEKLGGKPAEEYWNRVSDLAGHFKDHSYDFWRQMTREEYTAIGLEVIEQNKSNPIRYIHEGEPRFGFYDAASNIFVATNRDTNLKVHTIFKPLEGADYLQTLVFDLE